MAELKDYTSTGIGLVMSWSQSSIINFNGSSDYLEVYGFSNASGGPSAQSKSNFGAFRIGA